MIENTLMHKTQVIADLRSTEANYNGYSGVNERLVAGALNDVAEDVRFETGPWGRYYLPTNSLLVGAGSLTAPEVGLYHHTTQVEQRKAGTQTNTIGFHYVALAEPTNTVVWVNDAVPAGAVPMTLNDQWTWLGTPNPAAGTNFHRSDVYAGAHQHYFENATQTLSFGPEDSLFAYVRMGSANNPGQIMLQWQATDSTWWYHRAYWGGDLIAGWGTRQHLGSLPATNGWRRLEVSARQAGLVGRTIEGMAFTLYGGTADWDYAGKRSPRSIADFDGDGLSDVEEDWANGNGLYNAELGETSWTNYNSSTGLGSNLFQIYTPLR
jgi:hypothetical protein